MLRKGVDSQDRNFCNAIHIFAYGFVTASISWTGYRAVERIVQRRTLHMYRRSKRDLLGSRGGRGTEDAVPPVRMCKSPTNRLQHLRHGSTAWAFVFEESVDALLRVKNKCPHCLLTSRNCLSRNPPFIRRLPVCSQVQRMHSDTDMDEYR